jgi:hypothetical protein
MGLLDVLVNITVTGLQFAVLNVGTKSAFRVCPFTADVSNNPTKRVKSILLFNG